MAILTKPQCHPDRFHAHCLICVERVQDNRILNVLQLKDPFPYVLILPPKDEVVTKAARYSPSSPYAVGARRAFRQKGERRSEAYGSGFRLSPERRTGGHLRGMPHPKTKY